MILKGGRIRKVVNSRDSQDSSKSRPPRPSVFHIPQKAKAHRSAPSFSFLPPRPHRTHHEELRFLHHRQQCPLRQASIKNGRHGDRFQARRRRPQLYFPSFPAQGREDFQIDDSGRRLSLAQNPWVVVAREFYLPLRLRVPQVRQFRVQWPNGQPTLVHVELGHHVNSYLFSFFVDNLSCAQTSYQQQTNGDLRRVSSTRHGFYVAVFGRVCHCHSFPRGTLVGSSSWGDGLSFVGRSYYRNPWNGRQHCRTCDEKTSSIKYFLPRGG